MSQEGKERKEKRGMGLGVSSVVLHLPGKHKVLSLIPGIKKIKKRREKGRGRNWREGRRKALSPAPSDTSVLTGQGQVTRVFRVLYISTVKWKQHG